MKNALISLVCLSVFASPAFADAEKPKVYRDAEQAFLERTSLKAADEKCGYFTDLERSALISGQLQARGELLRSGIFSREAIEAAEREVAYYANSQPCGNADFINARAHLKSAFEAFIGTMVMDYPGLISTWNASRSRWDSWRVVQNGSSKDWLFQFGLLAPELTDPDAFPPTFARPLEAPLRTEPFDLAVEIFLNDETVPPSLARILIRDPVKAPEPWLGTIFGNEIAPPPIALTKTYWASGRTIITDEETSERKLRFTFSPDATDAIETLDPREQFQIAITPDPRAKNTNPNYLTVETGDFAAAHAFVKLPPL